MIKTGDRSFRITQIFAWGFIVFINVITQIIVGTTSMVMIINAIYLGVIGFAMTTAYRSLINRYKWENWSLGKLIGVMIFSSLLMSAIFTGIIYILFTIVSGEGAFEFPISQILTTLIVFSAIIAVWNLVYFLVHFLNKMNKTEIEKWQLKAEVKDAQLGALKAQISPHFVFNSLNNIRSLILEDANKAREMIMHFSDLFRYALKTNDRLLVPMENELEIVNLYLQLLSIQYDEKLTYSINVDEDLNQVNIPPMILQLLVENAVKHGISQYEEGGDIRINIKKVNSLVEIEVINVGRMGHNLTLGEHLGVGLENIKKRLNLIYDGKATFDISEQNESVIAIIKIPKE